MASPLSVLKTVIPLNLVHVESWETMARADRIDDIPDGNDHSIDAVRYAMMDDILRG